MRIKRETDASGRSEAEIDALFARTLADAPEDDDRWEAINALRAAGGRLIFDRAMTWCKSGDARKQLSGVNILAQIGRTVEHHVTDYADESYVVIEALLLKSPSTEMKSSAIAALYFFENPAAIPLICSFRNDADAEIRFSVAHALGYPFSNDHRAVEALLELMRDEDEDVRDWATFSLGAQGDADSPAIRDALVERLGDSFPNAREEAVEALAKRKDLRVLPALIELLQAETMCGCAEEAASYLLDLEWGDHHRTASELLGEILARYGA
ncbi:MAG: HEAT repeat domain-containing protein [Terracidiphilus sp.]|jgi:HEAT repeat protein